MFIERLWRHLTIEIPIEASLAQEKDFELFIKKEEEKSFPFDENDDGL